MSVRRAFIARLKAMSAEQPLPIRLVFWDGETFDLADQPAMTLILRSRKVLRWLLTGRFDRLGDAYVTGEIGVEGRVQDILLTGMALAERFGRLSRLAGVLKPLGWLSFRHSKGNDAAAIASHYDVSNDFYRIWLDDSMTYSCAYFPTGEEDIDEAQARKIDHICRKLRLSPGDHVLDIGCGWGGLLRRAARNVDITAVGVTNSPAQYELARQRVREDGLDGRVEIRLQDYRDIPGEAAFDKIVSVGMYEHVGLTNMDAYFGTVARLLKPGGAVLNHGIVTTDAEGRAKGPPGGEFINRHVFPGGELPNMPRVLRDIAASGLEAVDMEDLRPHYARTLLLWVERFEARAAEVIAAGGEERYRVWRIYLAGMALAFDRGWLSVAQVLAYKPVEGHPAPRPLSRDYQYVPTAAPSLSRALDWHVGRRPKAEP